MARPQADRDSQNVGLAVTELCGQAFPPNARLVVHVRASIRIPTPSAQETDFYRENDAVRLMVRRNFVAPPADQATLTSWRGQCPRWAVKRISAGNRTTATARTPVLRETTPVGALSAQLRRPRPQPGMSALVGTCRLAGRRSQISDARRWSNHERLANAARLIFCKAACEFTGAYRRHVLADIGISGLERHQVDPTGSCRRFPTTASHRHRLRVRERKGASPLEYSERNTPYSGVNP
jgi:hypothetical protein